MELTKACRRLRPRLSLGSWEATPQPDDGFHGPLPQSYPMRSKTPRPVSSSTAHTGLRPSRMRHLLTVAAPTVQAASSCDPAPPEQPIAPTNLPSSISGMPPRDAMMSSSVS
jgi:hypothetical protein